MSNSLFKLAADGEMSADHLSQICVALDKEKSPKIRQFIIDFDDICDAKMMELINATHQATLDYYKLGLGKVNENLAQTLLEVVNYNKKIEKCWMQLGRHHLYYRDNEMSDLNQVLQLGYSEKVTIDCQSMTSAQVDQLIVKLNQCDITQDFSIKIAKLDPFVAHKLIEGLSANQKLKILSFNINGENGGFDQTIERELVEMFSNFMQTTKEDFSQVSNVASQITAGALEHGKSLFSAFTSPLTACVSPAMDDHLLINNASAGKLKYE